MFLKTSQCKRFQTKQQGRVYMFPDLLRVEFGRFGKNSPLCHARATNQFGGHQRRTVVSFSNKFRGGRTVVEKT